MVNRKKVLILEIGGGGGIAHYAYNLSQELSKLLDVYLCTNEVYELESLQRNFKLLKYPFRGSSWFKAVFNVLSVLLKEKIQIIHIQTLISYRKDFIFLKVLRLLGFKIVFTVHNVYPHDEMEKNALLMTNCLKSIYKSSHVLITHFDANKNKLKNELSVDEDKIKVIPHGNYLFYKDYVKGISREEARDKIGIASSKKVYLSFGAIRAYKGIDLLVTAFESFARGKEDLELLIVGRDPEGIAKRLKESTSANVRFISEYIPIELMGLYFKAADIAVLPHLNSYGSGALHAAIAFALPVLASDLEGFDTMVEKNKNGYLFKAGNTEDLIDKLEKVNGLSSDELNSMAKYSEKLVKERFCWKAIAKKTLEVYG